MDGMTEYEAAILIQNLQFADRPRWEQTRLMMYSAVVPYSKKKITPTDIMKFSWEQSEAVNWSDEQIDEVEKQSAEFENLIKSMTAQQTTNGK